MVGGLRSCILYATLLGQKKKKKREMDRAGHNKIQGHRLEEGQKQKAVVEDGRRALGRAEQAAVEIQGSEYL